MRGTRRRILHAGSSRRQPPHQGVGSKAQLEIQNL
jgi:hypothetical protein